MIGSRPTPLQGHVSSFPQKSKPTLRRSDVLGFVGPVLLLVGAFFVFATTYPPPLWITWIIGPILWYVGAGTTVVWLLWRLFFSNERN